MITKNSIIKHMTEADESAGRTITQSVNEYYEMLMIDRHNWKGGSKKYTAKIVRKMALENIFQGIRQGSYYFA